MKIEFIVQNLSHIITSYHPEMTEILLMGNQASGVIKQFPMNRMAHSIDSEGMACVKPFYMLLEYEHYFM